MTEEETALDRAHATMEAAPEDEAARLRFYERLVESELFLLLAEESDGETIEPQSFPLDGGSMVLVFDRELRLAEFVGDAAHFAALSGRQIVRMLAGQGLGLGVNFGAPSEILLPPEGLDWLSEMLDNRPSVIEARPAELSAPGGVPEALLVALDAKFTTAAGLARLAYLAGVRYDDGRQSHLLAFVDAVAGAEGALAEAVGEALAFSGLEAGELDVAFFAASDPIAGRLARAGFRFDLPELPKETVAEIKAPGMDPDDPPILH